MHSSRTIAALTLLMALSVGSPAGTVSPGSEPVHAPSPASAVATTQHLPFHFEENRGQTDARVRFLARCRGYTAFLTNDEVVLAAGQDTVRMRFAGAEKRARPSAEKTAPGRSNYFIGNDEDRWITGVRHYASVVVPDVYPGIDARWYGTRDRLLRYDLSVAPGADPESIRFTLEGVDRVDVGARGELVAHTPSGRMVVSKPVLYQALDGQRRVVDGAFRADTDRTVSFCVGAYDERHALVIDPAIEYATYLGGSLEDEGLGLTLDSKGAVYIGGRARSTNFPTKSPYQATHGGSTADGFVAKFDADGNLVYATYLGGSADENAGQLAVGSTGVLYVAGWTGSTDFPLKFPIQGTHAGGANDGFVLKLNAGGSALVYSTYHGGTGRDNLNALDIDSTGAAHVGGWTESTDYPTKSALQSTHGGGTKDGTVAKINAAGSAVVFSTYVGGSAEDRVTSLRVDGGAVYLCGFTAATDFPTTNPLQSTHAGGGNDAFVMKLGSSGSTTTWSTYLGGAGDDGAIDLRVDSGGAVYLTGWTGSSDFPTKSPLQSSHGGGSLDGFAVKLAADGRSLTYGTYFGGTADDAGKALAVDSTGRAYVLLSTASSNLTTKLAAQKSYGGGATDAFLVLLSPTGTSTVYATYFGGSGMEVERTVATTGGFTGLAIDKDGAAHVGSRTSSTNLPTKSAFQTSYGGGAGDAFVAKLEAVGPPDAPTAVTATALSDIDVEIAWQDDGRATQFEVEREIGGGGFVLLDTVGASPFTDDTATGETSITYRVRGSNTQGNSAFSDTMTVTTPPIAPPDIVATILSNKRVDVSWTDGSQAETSYEVERRLEAPGEDFVALATLGPNATGNADTTPLPETTYTYRVRSVNSDGASRWVESAAATTPPRDPAEAAPAAVADTSVRISWRDLSDVETGYEIERGLGCPGVAFKQAGVVGAGVTSFTDFTAQPETTYAYRVRAVSDTGTSEWSLEICLRTAPAGPGDATGGSLSPSRVRIAWTDNSLVEQGFEVWRAREGEPFFVLLATVAANTTEFTDTTTLQESRYAYRVTAFDGNGTSNPAVVSDLDTPALLVLKAAKIKRPKGKKLKPAQLTAVGEFDVGDSGVALAGAATLEINGEAVSIDGFQVKGKKLRYQDDEILLDLKPAKTGSRVAFKLKASGDIVPDDPDGELTLRFTSGLFDAMGTITLSKDKFIPKKGQGRWVDPAFHVTSIKAALKSGADVLVIKAAFDGSGGVPDDPSDLTIEFGPVLKFTASGDGFTAKGSKLTFLQKLVGVRKITLDYAKGIAVIVLKGVELGVYEKGEVPVLLRVTSDTIRFEDTPVVVSNGKSLKY